MNKIYVVGIGPGGCDQMTGIAMNALKDSDTIIGYTVYVDLKRIFSGKGIYDHTNEKRRGQMCAGF